jgi:hypothetical protein
VPLALAQETLRTSPMQPPDPIRDKGVDSAQLLPAVLQNPKPGKLVESQGEDSRVEIALE